MRMLFTFAGGSGHFEPLVPIARAAVAAGHTVAFAGQAAMLPLIEAGGFTAFATGGPTLSARPERLPLLPVDQAREERDLREGFVRRVAHERASMLRALCTRWEPDLVVCDEVDFGAMVAAERLAIPTATVLVIAAGSFVRPDVVGAALDELRAAHGLPPDPDLAMLSRFLVLAPGPPSFRDPAFPLPATAHPMRALLPGTGDGPIWQPQPTGCSLIYFTLGTVFNVESGDLFERVLAGLRTLPVQVVATVGHALSPETFGAQPSHIEIARYIPQAAILPHCHLVVSHGGSGSVIGALAHGCPLVLLPMGADQLANGARCAALGVGRMLDPHEATPTRVRATVAAVLDTPAHAQAAARLRDENASLPGPEHAVGLLERLAATRRPLVAG